MATRKDPRAPCRPNDPPSLHERLIRGLIASDDRMCRNGFWRAFSALADEFGMGLEGVQDQRPFLPDAYLIDREKQVLRIFEVEVSLPLSDEKLSDYAWLWFCMEAEGHCEWMPELYVVDRYGHRNQINLLELYWRQHMPNAAKELMGGPEAVGG